MHYPEQVSTWVKQSVARVQAAKADGLNLDVEISQDDPQQLAGLVPACKQMADAMHAAQPGSHVTFDTPSEGETGSMQAKCGDMYGRDYDYKALASVLDFFVAMDYDSNDAHDAIPSAINYLPTTFAGPSPYIYSSRDQAVSEGVCATMVLHIA
jgi:spore germination protein YaaH